MSSPETMPEIIQLTSDSGCSTARISTHGATVLSWCVKGNERIFLSKLANHENPKTGKGIESESLKISLQERLLSLQPDSKIFVFVAASR